MYNILKDTFVVLRKKKKMVIKYHIRNTGYPGATENYILWVCLLDKKRAYILICLRRANPSQQQLHVHPRTIYNSVFLGLWEDTRVAHFPTKLLAIQAPVSRYRPRTVHKCGLDVRSHFVHLPLLLLELRARVNYVHPA